tara:strand:- start:325 stop:489 length:165 start_codon:yes stop_codon:yes gene_type:complete
MKIAIEINDERYCAEGRFLFPLIEQCLKEAGRLDDDETITSITEEQIAILNYAS